MAKKKVAPVKKLNRIAKRFANSVANPYKLDRRLHTMQGKYVAMQDHLNAAREKAALERTERYDLGGEIKELEGLIRVAGERLAQIQPEAAPQDQGKDAR